MSKFNSCRN
jgi:hypothetical protein